jgi:hypothetical protein
MKNLKRSTFGLSFLIALLCSSCTVKNAEVAGHDKNKIMDCKDTRDGETFSFNTNTVRDISVGIGGDSSFTVTTLDGKEKKFNSNMEAYIKCEKRT